MKNVLTFGTGGFLSLENIESGADSIVIRYYIHGLTAPKIKVEGVEYSLTTAGNYGEYTLNFVDITADDNTIHFCLTDNGTDYATFILVFYDFNSGGSLIVNQWQKRLQVYKTGNASVFHAYSVALIETDTTTVGDGLTVTEQSELKVNTGAGLTTTADGKVAAIQALKNVDSIEVTETNNRVSNITINYDDETTHSYACSYDNNGNLVSFGGVPITWE